MNVKQQQTDLIHRYFDEVWNRGRVEVLDDILTSDYINHSPSVPNPEPGPLGLAPIVEAMRRAFPDLRYDIEDIVHGEDSLAVRLTVSGTHRGDFFGIPPTGRAFCVTQINIERLREGRIAEHWRTMDELGLLRQLGVLPPTPPPPPPRPSE